MPIKIHCPTCGRTYQLKDEFYSRAVVCNQCKTRLAIPIAPPSELATNSIIAMAPERATSAINAITPRATTHSEPATPEDANKGSSEQLQLEIKKLRAENTRLKARPPVWLTIAIYLALYKGCQHQSWSPFTYDPSKTTTPSNNRAFEKAQSNPHLFLPHTRLEDDRR